MRKKPNIWKLILAVALIAVFCLPLISDYSITPEIPSPREVSLDTGTKGLTAHFIDVGQGDSTLLESDGEYVLIDAGELEVGTVVRDYILNLGAKKLKYVIATHPHSDHIGGIRTVLDGVGAENFIAVETDCDTVGWTKTLKKVDALGINYIDAAVGDRYSFGEASFTILAPNSSKYSGGYNNYSVALKAEYGDISFIFTGDAGRDSELEMLENGVDLDADVLKCGHHGSSDATTLSFLREVDPAFAIISCGKRNKFGHPHRELIKRLELLGCKYLRTDQVGTIVASTDGTKLRFNVTDDVFTAGDRVTTPRALTYVGNSKSMCFHDPTCDAVAVMSEENKVDLATRKEAIDAGYTPCTECNP